MSLDKYTAEEIKTWEERSFFGESEFKEDNKKPDSPLFQLVRSFASSVKDGNFKIMSCEYEIQCYKIPKLMIEKLNFVNDDFTFEHGMNINVFIGDPSANDWSLQAKVREYVELRKNDFRDKIVIIPKFDAHVNSVIALYLAFALDKAKASGIIFSYGSNDVDSFMHSLALGYYKNLIQFPKTTVQPSTYSLKEDNL